MLLPHNGRVRERENHFSKGYYKIRIGNSILFIQFRVDARISKSNCKLQPRVGMRERRQYLHEIALVNIKILFFFHLIPLKKYKFLVNLSESASGERARARARAKW